MKKELTVAELEKENEEIKALLSKVVKAYDLIDKELEQYKKKMGNEENSTISSIDDVKKLLDKYSRL